MAHNVNKPPNHTTKVGIWHTTTLQSAQGHRQPIQQQQHLQQQHQTHQTTVLAGQKRSISESHTLGASSTSTHGPQDEAPKKRQSIGGGGPKELPRLTASPIVHTDDDPGAEGGGGMSEYTQRRTFPSTPTSTIDPLLSLSHPRYGLPAKLVANFASLGIRTIYPWQKQCLLGPGLLTGEKNLVYSAPTGGGKSLVADVLMLKRVLDVDGDLKDAKALLVLPYVALVQEKVRWLRNVVAGISREELLGHRKDEKQQQQQLWVPRADKDTIRVVGFFGGSKIKATWNDFDIGVCTIEKVGRYNMVIRRFKNVLCLTCMCCRFRQTHWSTPPSMIVPFPSSRLLCSTSAT